MNIRTIEADDLEPVRAVVADSGLFSPELLDGMMAPYLAGAGEAIWLCAERSGAVTGFAYAVPEPLTDGTWNMLALGVRSADRRSGVATALTRGTERAAKTLGARLLVVDTSGSEAYEAARSFYAAAGYGEEARIRDYWAAGDDKVVFRKAL